jgi:hypothetical protein
VLNAIHKLTMHHVVLLTRDKIKRRRTNIEKMFKTDVVFKVGVKSII